MVLKDPNPKVTYSFRLRESLLNSIKQYAHANNLSLPQAMNILLENSIKGYTLTNTYLKENVFIIIPYMKHKVIKAIGEPNRLVLDIGTNSLEDITDIRNKGLDYGVTAIPNNLDIWHPHIGYTAKGENLEHEGISVIICSELIQNDLVKNMGASVKECLKFIHFKQYNTKQVRAHLINYKEALLLLKKADNTEIYNYYSEIINLVWAIADKVEKECESQGVAYLENKDNTYKELLEIEKLFNDPFITKIKFGDKNHNRKLSKLDYDLLKSYKKELEKEAKQIEIEKEALIEMLAKLEKEEQLEGAPVSPPKE